MLLKQHQELLKDRHFLFLWIEQGLTQVAYNIINFSLIVAVYKLTNSNFSVGILLLCFFIPSAIFTLIAGITSDFVHRKRIIIFSNLIWSVLVIALSLWRHNFLAILIMAVLIQITDEFFYNANGASLPCVVGKEQLLLANSLFSITYYASMILGSLIVGVLNRFVSEASPFYLASFLVAGGAFLVSKIKFSQKTSDFSPRKPLLEQITLESTKGWRFIINSPTARILAIFLAVANSLLVLLLALSPGILSAFGIRPDDFSFVFVLPLSIGLLLGSIFLGKFGKSFRKISLIQKGLIFLSLMLLFFAFIPRSEKLSIITQKRMGFESKLGISAPLAMIVALMGFSGILIFVPANTSFQEILPDEIRGRVSSTCQLLSYSLSALLSLSSGFISDTLGFFPIFLFISLTSFFAGIFSRKILVKTNILES